MEKVRVSNENAQPSSHLPLNGKHHTPSTASATVHKHRIASSASSIPTSSYNASKRVSAAVGKIYSGRQPQTQQDQQQSGRSTKFDTKEVSLRRRALQPIVNDSGVGAHSHPLGPKSVGVSVTKSTVSSTRSTANPANSLASARARPAFGSSRSASANGNTNDTVSSRSSLRSDYSSSFSVYANSSSSSLASLSSTTSSRAGKSVSLSTVEQQQQQQQYDYSRRPRNSNRPAVSEKQHPASSRSARENDDPDLTDDDDTADFEDASNANPLYNKIYPTNNTTTTTTTPSVDATASTETTASVGTLRSSAPGLPVSSNTDSNFSHNHSRSLSASSTSPSLYDLYLMSPFARLDSVDANLGEPLITSTPAFPALFPTVERSDKIKISRAVHLMQARKQLRLYKTFLSDEQYQLVKQEKWAMLRNMRVKDLDIDSPSSACSTSSSRAELTNKPSAGSKLYSSNNDNTSRSNIEMHDYESPKEDLTDYEMDQDGDDFDSENYNISMTRSFRQSTPHPHSGSILDMDIADDDDDHQLVMDQHDLELDLGDSDEEDDDEFDPNMVCDYSEDVFRHMLRLEVAMAPSPVYMDHQPELDWAKRGILVEWLVQVHSRFRLLPETLYLTINYVDRFLTLKSVTVSNLQLVGAVALFLAAKYEEITCPSVNEIVYMVDNGYSDSDILRAEKYMVKLLDFKLSWPGPMSFLRRTSKADDYDLEIRTLAKYLLEVTLMDKRFVCALPSWTAASAYYLAKKMLNRGGWDAAHVYYSGYTEEQLLLPVSAIMESCRDPNETHKAIFDKYCDRRFKKAALFVADFMKNLG